MKEKAISVLKDATGEAKMETNNLAIGLYIRKLIRPVLMLALLYSTASAQFNLNTGFNMSYNDNINSNYQFLSDEVTEFFFESGYSFPSKNKNFELYYEGSFNYFRRNVDRTFHEHSAGIVYSSSFGKKLISSLNIGGAYHLSLNRNDYTYLDYNGASAYANYRTYIGKRTSWQLGYTFNYYNYNEISDFNNFQNYVYTSLTGHLPSRTTLSIETGFGAKTYMNSLTTTSTTGMGSGKHKMGNSTVLGESVMRLDVMGRISQSIFERTGFSLSAGYTKNLSSNERYLISGNVTGNDNVLDDEYSFEGPFTDASLTQRLPWSMAAVLSGSFQYRNFIDRPAYDLNENLISDTRTDKVFSASLRFVKNFENFGIILAYSYIQNSTNDEYYNFKNNIFSIELGAGF
jgi:hypothetical protein